MRLWSIHPRYLDRIGLVACWREGLLAQAVLQGRTKGYKNHPQLERFTEATIGGYLWWIYRCAVQRGYNFDVSKIDRPVQVVPTRIVIPVGQIVFECGHLRRKIEDRSPTDLYRVPDPTRTAVMLHPLFQAAHGPVASWEKGAKTEN